MAKIFHPLLALIASASNNELAKYIEYLKAENKILRARIPGQIHTTKTERETLVKFGKAIGRAIEELITIVSASTFYRWLRDGEGKVAKNPKGGQRKPREIRELVIMIAKTTGFGLTRIVGELRKMGIKKISRQTVRNILKEEGMEPVPDRTEVPQDSDHQSGLQGHSRSRRLLCLGGTDSTLRGTGRKTPTNSFPTPQAVRNCRAGRQRGPGSSPPATTGRCR